MGLELVRAVCAGGEASALATILQVQGSSPRHPGAKMLAGVSGHLAGTVGGGRGEAVALEACRRALASGACERVKVEMVGNEVTGAEMVCGGVTTQLIEPLADLEPYRIALGRLEAGERVLLVKRLRGGEAGPVQVEVALLDEDGRALYGRPDPADARPAARALDRDQARLDPDTGVFYDPLLPQEKLLILGAGHVGQALAALAPALGFQVTVVDDRAEFLAEGRLAEGVQAVHAGFERAIAEFPFDSATYVVVVTRGHQSDLQCVRAVLGRRWRYAGFMGSARKARLILDQVAKEGFDPEKVAALCGPIGLDIAAETPAELAVAILGELVAVRRHAPILPALDQARAGRRA